MEPFKLRQVYLNDKNAVKDMPRLNPLMQKKAKLKPMKLPKAKMGVAAATPIQDIQSNATGCVQGHQISTSFDRCFGL